ncbi:PA2778 family cysteine peptidase [Marinobacteraceae bacterium S3BR75-40.1]
MKPGSGAAATRAASAPPSTTAARRHGLPLLLLILLLAGCATPPMSRKVLEAPPSSLPRQYELTTVPFFPQERYQCGPAALATVLNAWDRQVTPETLVPEVYLPEREGSLPVEMKAAARQRGMVTYPLAPSVEDLLKEIAAGHPVLVMQNLSIDWWPQWHYAVAVGYDLNKREIVLRSGRMKRRTTELGTFERTWERADYWALVVLPPNRLPATAEALPYMEAAGELETAGQDEAAGRAYRTAFQQWPEHPLSLMDQGNRAYAQGAYDDATRLFLKLVHTAPDKAYAWNNLGYSLAAQGCPSKAQQAVHCAARLEPQDNNIQASVEEIGALEASGRCPSTPLPDCPEDP